MRPIFKALFAVIVFAFFYRTCSVINGTGETASQAASSFANPAKPTAPTGWIYGSQIDALTQKANIYATVESAQTLQFSRPYEGRQRASLTVVKRPQNNIDVMLQIERGQFMCHMHECAVQVRFGDGPIQRYIADGPSDNSTTVIFLRDTKRFISNAKKVGVVTIQATFFHQGNQVMRFEGGPLRWN